MDIISRTHSQMCISHRLVGVLGKTVFWLKWQQTSWPSCYEVHLSLRIIGLHPNVLTGTEYDPSGSSPRIWMVVDPPQIPLSHGHWPSLRCYTVFSFPDYVSIYVFPQVPYSALTQTILRLFASCYFKLITCSTLLCDPMTIRMKTVKNRTFSINEWSLVFVFFGPKS